MIADDQQIINEFVIEASEHLAEVENQLLSIEATGAKLDVELVHQVFRNVHSIKGAAGFLGFQSIGALAHHLESVLNHIRNLELTPDGCVIETLLSGFDTLRQMLHTIEKEQEFEIAHHIAELQAIASQALTDSAMPQSGVKLESFAANVHQQCAPLEVVELTKQESNAPQPIAAELTTPAEVAATPRQESNIRVSVTILDRLMNLAGELVLGRNQLLQYACNRADEGIDLLSSRIDQITSDLQEAIMGARMQQVAAVFNRFPRLVRDVSQKLGKQVRLVTEGAEVEIDKSILELIADPLTHVIRNSIDHGIERPEVRAAAGKPCEGTVLLRACHQAGKVHLTVSDDGGGMPPARLKEKAVKKGLITAEQAAAMSDRDAIRLVFAPGFSTAEVVTEVSGRGVGMDVVKTNIEKLGGNVEIESVPGQGTTIHIKLPLTLAIIPSLIVGITGERYAVPESAIIELVRVVPRDPHLRIDRFNNAEVLRLRGKLLPLVRLDQVLGATVPEQLVRPKAAQHVIVVEASTFRYGIVVDSVLDPEQIVVKPLGTHLKSCRCLSGATVLGDGQVAFILDIPGIAEQARLVGPQASAVGNAIPESTDPVAEVQMVMVLRGCSQDLYAVPMAMVSRIERVDASQLSQVGDRLLMQYRGGALPLVELEAGGFAASKLPANVYVLVFETGRREIGLIAPHLVDIREAGCDIDTRGPHVPGVIGVMVLDGEFVRLLDLCELAGAISVQAEGRDRRGANGTPVNANRRGTALLAEDSPFFREQVARLLEDDGLSVVVCPDGQIAWETLCQEVVKLDLIITDIEMPRLNGFDFCRQIRGDARFQHLPVIALTSMSDARHIRRGAEVGITDYQLKMDRERLLTAIHKFIPLPAAIRRGDTACPPF